MSRIKHWQHTIEQEKMKKLKPNYGKSIPSDIRVIKTNLTTYELRGNIGTVIIHT